MTLIKLIQGSKSVNLLRPNYYMSMIVFLFPCIPVDYTKQIINSMNEQRPYFKLIKAWVLILLGAASTNLSAQDIHFSQFYHSTQNLNPALTGVFQGDKRFVANYRNQWASVPVDYTTFSGAYDMKLFLDGLEHSTFGVGAIFNYDQAGAGRLNTTNLGLNIGYTHRIGQRNFIGAGFGLGFSNRGFNPDRLTTNSQFDGDVFNFNLPTGEEDIFRNENIFFLDFSAGVNYHYQIPKKRTRLDVGVAMMHINEPAINFYGNSTIQLPKRINIFGEMTFMLNQDIDLLGRVLFQFQEDYRENVFGIAGRLYLKKDKQFNDLALQLGLSLRTHSFTDAIIPNIELHYNRWVFGLSYDVNTSEFSTATNGRGGLELAAIYKIFNVKTLPVFKHCPIY